jgi:hypothetical protein
MSERMAGNATARCGTMLEEHGAGARRARTLQRAERDSSECSLDRCQRQIPSQRRV